MDMSERVAAMEVTQAKLEERVDVLGDRFNFHEKKQNGSIQRLEEKVDILAQKSEKRMNGIYTLLVGLMSGVITSLILLLVNMSIGR